MAALAYISEHCHIITHSDAGDTCQNSACPHFLTRAQLIIAGVPLTHDLTTWWNPGAASSKPSVDLHVSVDWDASLPRAPFSRYPALFIWRASSSCGHAPAVDLSTWQYLRPRRPSPPPVLPALNSPHHCHSGPTCHLALTRLLALLKPGATLYCGNPLSVGCCHLLASGHLFQTARRSNSYTRWTCQPRVARPHPRMIYLGCILILRFSAHRWISARGGIRSPQTGSSFHFAMPTGPAMTRVIPPLARFP